MQRNALHPVWTLRTLWKLFCGTRSLTFSHRRDRLIMLTRLTSEKHCSAMNLNSWIRNCNKGNEKQYTQCSLAVTNETYSVNFKIRSWHDLSLVCSFQKFAIIILPYFRCIGFHVNAFKFQPTSYTHALGATHRAVHDC